jgi:hypothetical protein
MELDLNNINLNIQKYIPGFDANYMLMGLLVIAGLIALFIIFIQWFKIANYERKKV